MTHLADAKALPLVHAQQPLHRGQQGRAVLLLCLCLSPGPRDALGRCHEARRLDAGQAHVAAQLLQLLWAQEGLSVLTKHEVEDGNAGSVPDLRAGQGGRSLEGQAGGWARIVCEDAFPTPHWGCPMSPPSRPLPSISPAPPLASHVVCSVDPAPRVQQRLQGQAAQGPPDQAGA